MKADLAQPLRKVLETQNAQAVFDFFYDKREQSFELTPRQQEIVEKILFSDERQICINCYTRYGKTQIIVLAAGILIAADTDHEVAFIAPTSDRHEKMREYMSQAITNSTILTYLVELSGSKIDRLTSESTKRRQTFKNGSSYRFFHSSNADQLMSFGAKTVIADEDQDISRDAQENISRMLLDHPSTSLWIKSFNPVRKDTHTYEAWTSPDWHNERVPWKTGVEEGRVTRDEIEKRKEQLRDWKFEALYNCNFPDKTEDALFGDSDYRYAVSNQRFNLVGEAEILLEEQNQNNDGDGLQGFERRIACDVARKGEDQTVIGVGYKKGNLYHVEELFVENQSDTMNIARRINRIARTHGIRGMNTRVFVDGHGIGAGVIDRLQDLREDSYEVVDAKYGAKANKPDVYKNKKAESYDRLAKIHEDKRIRYPENDSILHDLTRVKADFTSGEKMKVGVEGGGSPDYSDMLTYFTWKDSERAAMRTLRL